MPILCLLLSSHFAKFYNDICMKHNSILPVDLLQVSINFVYNEK